MTHEETAALFASHILARRVVFKEGKRLVHYTSAEAAFLIISGRQIWLRNAQMMNDYSEIQYGINCLIAAWESPNGLALQALLNRIKDGLRDELAALFDGHAEGLRTGTFITSLSEHEDDEDELGRLSMWRAYGGRARVALVLNNTAIASETDEMRVFSSPVFYQSVPTFVAWFQQWAAALLNAENKLHELGAEQVRNWVFMLFRSFALCTKHPGFAEEREWRVFYSPFVEGDSDWIEPSIEIVNGVPQHVMKLRLKDDHEKGVTGVAPDTLLNRVIIGPCDYPVQIRASLGEAMQRVGIASPYEMMCMSLIPLRHS